MQIALLAKVPSTGAMDHDLPGVHVGTDPMDTIEIAKEFEALLAGVSGVGKHVSQWESSIAVVDFKSLDSS